MARTLTPSVLSASTATEVSPFLAVDLDFTSGSIYLWSGYGDLVIGSKTYLGAGNLLNVSTIEETSELEARGATISLSGVPSQYLAVALAEPFQGRPCRIYFGVTSNPSEYVEVFSGEVDQMPIEEGAESCVISVTVENIMVRFERPVVLRLTKEDQQSRFPTDKGLNYVASLQDKEIFWGRKAD
ncbi:hypothetical protein UFOVP346_43 [uncultured Caudovirales phage]|uniref:Uncharacterized protein n=1 Tax=uncultured Caudovirales phage TaxID=2100421 RepID=A0A6J5M6D8_9CAUD|nr:hypothetical protein UFOVP346_43 [uncultured Caudovirales phage]